MMAITYIADVLITERSHGGRYGSAFRRLSRAAGGHRLDSSLHAVAPEAVATGKKLLRYLCMSEDRDSGGAEEYADLGKDVLYDGSSGGGSQGVMGIDSKGSEVGHSDRKE